MWHFPEHEMYDSWVMQFLSRPAVTETFYDPYKNDIIFNA
jgi:hypothetical protein